MTVAYSILSRIQQAMSFFVRSLEASEGQLNRKYLILRQMYRH